MMLIHICFVLVLTCTAFGQDPIVRIKQTDPETKIDKRINAPRGADVSLTCHVENLPINTYVRWEKYFYSGGKLQTYEISKDQGLHDNTKYGLEKPNQFTWKLRIEDVQISDIGNYSCFVYAISQVKKNDFRIVNVFVPPQLDPEKTSPDTTVDEGDDIDLSCNATGLPPPSITWSRMGNALLPIGKEKHMFSILPIRDIRPEDRGIYRCTVSNAMVDPIIRDIHLDVKFKPVITADTLVEQARGYRIELQCLAEANPFPDESQIQWIKDTQTISITGGNYEVKIIRGAFNRLTYELIIHSVGQNDYGKYTCRIRNAMGTATKDITLREVAEPQKSVKLGMVIKGSSTTVYYSLLLVCICLILHIRFVYRF